MRWLDILWRKQIMVQSKHDPPKNRRERRWPREEEELRPVSVRYHNGKGWEDRAGYFHCWSSYTDDDGISKPIAIIEWLDGSCTDKRVDDITFTDRE